MKNLMTGKETFYVKQHHLNHLVVTDFVPFHVGVYTLNSVKQITPGKIIFKNIFKNQLTIQ